jgi:hypothetical protein
MSSTTSKVLAKVNASYATCVTAGELASNIANKDSVSRCDCHVFTFLSEVPAPLQQAFIEEMGVSKDAVLSVAKGFSEFAGFDMALLG